jgi:DNA-binding beta-propeller fold protein YncE
VRRLLAGWLLIGACASGRPAVEARSPTPEATDYLVFVASEGNDRIALVRFGGGVARVEREEKIGLNPTELVGPHGLYVSPDHRWYYVTTAHGTPNGALWKFAAATGEQAGRVELGLFPATLQVAPNGHYAWVSNFNLYGDKVPSSVSVVYLEDMLEVRRVPTCVMPHGSRLSPDGKRHYSVCMMNDALIEIDADRMEVSRHFVLTAGRERGGTGSVSGEATEHDHEGHAATCSPTWAEPSADGSTVWVACSKSNELVEIEVASWTVKRRIPAGDGIYNLAASRDGRFVVATNKRAQSVSVFEAESGRELAKVPTTRRLPSGLVISPDSRYAFVTQEGIGSEPGTVDVIDLGTRARVASVDVGQQAGGIDVWKTE